MAKKALYELLSNMEDVNLEEVEVMTNPMRTLKDGVKFIPTLKCGEEQVSGILLSRSKIEEFLQRMRRP